VPTPSSAGSSRPSRSPPTRNEIKLPGGEWKSGDDPGCNGKPAKIVLAKWARESSEEPTIIEDDFGDVRFLNDDELYTVAYVAEDFDLTSIPKPPSVSELARVRGQGDVPASATTTPAVTDTTVAGGDRHHRGSHHGGGNVHLARADPGRSVSVRAVVLVGGFGTRLRPLTLTRPKQMLTVGQDLMIEVVLGHLGRHGVTEAVLALGYKPDAFRAAFPDGTCAGMQLRYAVESEPLDTAGAIRFAATEAGFDRGDEPLVVVNGDVLTTLDVRDLVAFHRSRGAEGTIHLIPVEDPSAFGVVPTDDDGRVLAFIEKPPRDEAPTNLINAGTYVLEPSVLDRIDAGRPVSIERETFPGMVADGCSSPTPPTTTGSTPGSRRRCCRPTSTPSPAAVPGPARRQWAPAARWTARSPMPSSAPVPPSGSAPRCAAAS
jgi:UTP-glucose-1-phosphate uridylyltransferase